MSLNRIKTILLHNWYFHIHSLEAVIDTFWYPVLNVFVFGFLSVFFAANQPERARVILLGIGLWQIVTIAQMSMAMGVLREVWSKNLSNLFTTPVTVEEYNIALILVALIKAIVVFAMMATLMYFVYHFSFLKIGGYLIFAFISLLIFACSTGIFITGLIFRYGTRIQALSWSLVFIFQPLTAALYPLKILPEFLQKFALLFPTTYVFENARSKLQGQPLNIEYIFISAGENLLYFALSYWFFMKMFKKSKETGQFARLEG